MPNTDQLITIAKGLTSAYTPLSGSIVSDRVWKVLEEGTDRFGPIGHGWTYSAHPLCAAAGVANLELIDELGLVENAGTVGAAFKQALVERLGDHPNVGEIRGDRAGDRARDQRQRDQVQRPANHEPTADRVRVATRRPAPIQQV